VIASGAFGAGVSAQTGTISGIIDVPAGQRRCIDLSTKAFNNASVDDFVVSGHKVKFVFLGEPDGALEFIEIDNSGPDPVSSFSRMISAGSHPSFFPGLFRTCARNMSEKPSRVSLTLAVDR
jgi:hypothetical protein